MPDHKDNPNTIEDVLLRYGHRELALGRKTEEPEDGLAYLEAVELLQRMQDEARLQEWESYIAAARQEFGEGVYPSREWENLYIKGRLEALRTNKENRMSKNDLIEQAWTIIANAFNGNWDEASPEWRQAAEKWRDEYHKHLERTKQETDNE